MEICQYFKCGYCKFRVHVENAMSKKYVKSMVARKPVIKDIQKHVEFFAANGYCPCGRHCLYFHKTDVRKEYTDMKGYVSE